MNTLVPIGQARMPAAMKARIDAGRASNSNFGQGIRDAYPTLSIRGKVFRIRKDGTEIPLVDPQTRQALPYLDVIMLNASPAIAKSFYLNSFDANDMLSPPDCWSLDGVKPDASVLNKVSPACANCRNNIFGSAVAQDGNPRGGKACSDTKRIAVMMPGHLGKDDALMFLMRVPATSLKNLKAYTDLVERQGWDIAGCVTRLSFDYQQAFPKLDFKFVDSLTDEEYNEVCEHADSPAVASMLSAPEFQAGLSDPHPAQNPATKPMVRQEAPILDDTQTIVDRPAPGAAQAAQQAAPVNTVPQRQAATMAAVPERELIELPDGLWADAETGEIVERRTVPEVDMPALDPDVLTLTNGQFFNKKTKQYVTGPNVGDPPVGAPAAPAKEVKRRTTKKAAPAATPQEEAQVDAMVSQQPAGRQQVDIAAQASQQASPDPTPAQASNGTVKAASADMEAMLRDIMPTRKQ